jgi:B12-binding domain/radical SAM domain protein
MSICFRGAIECARLIKSALGDEVLIVLGGRHASETIYFDQACGGVVHHAGSPLRLMASGAIDSVFDVVISGDGEHIIYELGVLVANAARDHVPPAHVAANLRDLEQTPGRWIAGTVRDGQIALVSSAGADIDYDAMIAPCEAFGVTTSFDLFGGKPTAHVFSDTGRGCVYDCAFCSERISVVGAPRQTRTSVARLVGQLEAASRVIAADHGGQQASAFCEDSTLLGFSPKLVDEFCRLMESRRVSISFGGQATIDQLLNRPQLLPGLRASGFEYVFIGLETPDPLEIGGMSKDIGKKNGSWLDRADRCCDLLCANDIKMGVSLLFGLGESAVARDMLFDSLSRWRSRYGQPVTVSMNWAVQHPLAGNDAGTAYSYTDWAIPDGEELDVLRHFGEASTRYPLAGQQPPVLAEARAIVETIDAIRSAPIPHAT